MFFDQVVGGLAHGANAGQAHRVARAISTLVSTPSLGSPMKIQVTNVQVSEFVRVLMSAFFLFFGLFAKNSRMKQLEAQVKELKVSANFQFLSF